MATSTSKVDRFFEAAMRLTVVCGGAVYIGEDLARYLATQLPNHAMAVRAGCLSSMLALALWSQWAGKRSTRLEAPAEEPASAVERPARHVKRMR